MMDPSFTRLFWRLYTNGARGLACIKDICVVPIGSRERVGTRGDITMILKARQGNGKKRETHMLL